MQTWISNCSHLCLGEVGRGFGMVVVVVGDEVVEVTEYRSSRVHLDHLMALTVASHLNALLLLVELFHFVSPLCVCVLLLETFTYRHNGDR
jgi:hypothetical protein